MRNKDLTEVTTARQKANGTRMFHCSRTNTYYGSYASGYIRRGIPSNFPSPGATHIFYQINKTTSSYISSYYSFDDKPYKVRSRALIASPTERLMEIDRLSSHYQTCFHP